MKSVWQEQKMPIFPELPGDLRTDVLIIGGGIAGILTAYFLNREGVNCALVERGRICGGNTGGTTAKITAQHGLVYHKMAKEFGLEAVRLYYEANCRALEEYAKLCAGIDCDYQRKDNVVYSVDSRQKVEAEMEILQRIGARADYLNQVSIPVSITGAVRFFDQAQFHPLKFLGKLSEGLQIYENTVVRELKGSTAVTNRGCIHAEKIVCATHFPFINKHGSYFLKLYQSRSYVLALENAQEVDAMYVDEKDCGLSFRNNRGLLLLGGGGGRTGTSCGGWEQLRHFAREHYPKSQERYFWAAQDCMTLDGMLYAGPFSGKTKNFFVETGFNKWGMTGSMVAAGIVRDQIMGVDNPYAELFSPSRSMLRKQLWINGLESGKNLLSPRQKTCPHLGCALKWNEAEHSWDCPCHGSRFTEEGTLLDNPATGDLPDG